jgi:hypothetical protein
MIKRFIVAVVLLAPGAAPCLGAPALTVDAPPSLSAWTTPEFAAFTRATGITVRVTDTAAGADILIAPAPGPQIAEHEKLTLPYEPRATAHIPDDLKDDDGDWTALALTALAFTDARAAAYPAAQDALLLLLSHTGGASPPGTPALLMTLSRGPAAAINFYRAPNGGFETVTVPYFIARLKSGQQPAAAAKLIDYLLDISAQRELSVLLGALPARTDVTPVDPLGQFIEKRLSGVVVYTPDWHKARRILDHGGN